MKPKPAKASIQPENVHNDDADVDDDDADDE